MADKIYDANDRALEECVMLGLPYKSHRERILYWSTKLGCQWTGQVVDSPAVVAFIHFSSWVARSDCGNLEYVTPADRIFFCHACGNLQINRAARPVIFPADDERQAIEAALLDRSTTPGLAITPIDQARLATADVPDLDRSWQPDETADDLVSETTTLTASYQAAQLAAEEKQP